MYSTLTYEDCFICSQRFTGEAIKSYLREVVSPITKTEKHDDWQYICNEHKNPEGYINP